MPARLRRTDGGLRLAEACLRPEEDCLRLVLTKLFARSHPQCCKFNKPKHFDCDLHVQTPQRTNMLARTSLRQVFIVARASPARTYTSSIKEGSVASSKEFGYVSVASAPATSELSEAHKQIPLCFCSPERRRRLMKACFPPRECSSSRND